VRSYQILNYAEDLKETCGYIAEYYPDPAGPRRLCAAVTVAEILIILLSYIYHYIVIHLFTYIVIPY
jgi:hypothetical protein